MATIVTKFSDYTIHSVEYFISQIGTELGYRDLPGLTNFEGTNRSTIEIINVTKQHPLVALMAATINPNSNVDDLMASIIPSISVTPGNLSDKGFTLGQTLTPELVDDDFITELTTLLGQTNKEIQSEVLISKNQIETIIGEYNRASSNGMRLQKNEFFKNEEINISVWSENADEDVFLGNLMDSILATLQVGFAGDNSRLRDFQYKINKGLTNFNFGRILFGSEYNLTFLNSYNNYIIYTDPVISGHDFIGTYEIPGDE